MRCVAKRPDLFPVSCRTIMFENFSIVENSTFISNDSLILGNSDLIIDDQVEKSRNG